MRRAELFLLIAVLALGYISVNQYLSQRKHLATISSLQDDVSREQEKGRRLQRSVNATTSKNQTSRKEVKEVLSAHPALRDTPVPPAVVSSLCKQIRCQ